MYGYTVAQWLFFFYFYSFFGWCVESAFVSFCKKKLVNRGFVRGPFLPLYGSGAMMMLLVSIPMRHNLLLVYMGGCLGATLLEYVTGVTMEALFKVRYWDYSKQKFNFQGQICLGSTLAWGGLTILMTEVIHKPIERLSLLLPPLVLHALVIVLTVFLAADFAMSFKAALDLREVLVKLDRVRQELEHMQKRLDVIIAIADDEIGSKLEAKKLEYANRTEARFGAIEERLANIRERLSLHHSRSLEKSKEELSELSARFGALQASRPGKWFLKNFYRRHMLLDNPTMYSRKFKETLEELKQAAEHRGK